MTGTARFVVANARRSDNPDHQAVLHRARYFRVVEALHTAVTSSSHTSLATRILGEVPILSDGSACFEAPADTPLFLEPVDAAGRRLEFDWKLPETSVPVGSKQNLLEMTYITARPGETKSCNGCHAPQSEAVGAASTVAALRHGPVSIERDLTDLLYRRNEPDEYRASLRLGETGTYRDWLSSPDADVRRRGCEALMAVEDGARQDAPAIAGLLRDASAVVRRAAARALARLGSVACLPALLDALDDQDWQVRFNAAAALEAITACAAGAEGGDSPGDVLPRAARTTGRRRRGPARDRSRAGPLVRTHKRQRRRTFGCGGSKPPGVWATKHRQRHGRWCARRCGCRCRRRCSSSRGREDGVPWRAHRRRSARSAPRAGCRTRRPCRT